MNTLNYKTILSIAVLLAVIGVLSIIWQRPWEVGASVPVGNQYQSTTTPQVADLTNLCPARSGMASSTTGILGSVNVLTGGNGGYLAIFDATTSDATQRVAIATTSMTLAWLPITASTTSYHFDVEFKRGLLIDYTATVATTTISYRCES